MTGLLAAGAVAVGLGWLGTVHAHDREATTVTVPRGQVAVEALLFAITLGLTVGAFASLVPGSS